MKQFFLAVLAALPFFISTTSAEAQPSGEAIELTFVDHLKAGLTEQDVFVEKVPGSGLVFQVPPKTKTANILQPYGYSFSASTECREGSIAMHRMALSVSCNPLKNPS